jgi:hypothetical protein
LWGLSAGEEGHTGESFAFLVMVWRADLVFDEGVIDGTQNEGNVVFEAW